MFVKYSFITQLKFHTFFHIHNNYACEHQFIHLTDFIYNNHLRHHLGKLFEKLFLKRLNWLS